MQKGTNSDADNEEPFHNDIGQSGDRHVKKHCNTMNIYFMSSYIHHNHCAYCDQGQIDCSIEQRKMKSLYVKGMYLILNISSTVGITWIT